MSITAMKQALEALKRADKISGHPNNKKTIVSLRQAIEKAERQEPVAWWYGGHLHEFDPTDWAEGEVIPLYTHPLPTEERNFCPRCGKRTADLTDIHTCTPPLNAKREWVGLTDEEVGMLTVFEGLHHVEIPLLANFARAIEAKLKAKNI